MRPLEVHLELLRRLPVRTVASKRKPPLPCVYYSNRISGSLRDVEEQVRLIRRVLRMAAAGVERPDIAEALNLSTGTVDKYLAGNISKAAKAALRRSR
jgi:DNA-binding NarL/FixJ family response regulator